MERVLVLAQESAAQSCFCDLPCSCVNTMHCANVELSSGRRAASRISDKVLMSSGKAVGLEAMPTLKYTLLQRLIQFAFALGCGLVVAGRANFHTWAVEVDSYIADDERSSLIFVVYESGYLIARVVVGGYGGYALLRDYVQMTRPPLSRESEKAGSGLME